MAVRVNLSISEDIFELIKKDANQRHCTVNGYLNAMLEGIYAQNPFDYQAALELLEKEAKEQPVGKDFVLAELPSFSEICIARASDAKLKPSVVRARLGKMFNARVREGKAGDVRRSKEDDGALKFVSRAAVYCKKSTNIKE